MRKLIFLFLLICSLPVFSQKTRVEGSVRDAETGQIMPFVSVRFQDSKIGTLTDTNGRYILDTYYATDSLVFFFSGYLKKTIAVKRDQSQMIDVVLEVPHSEIEEVIVLAPDEFPSTILHKKVIAHKHINNKAKLESYEYEVYNKVQLDVNNIDDKFKDRGVIKRLDLILSYLDSSENGNLYLPFILSESVSDYYYRNEPKSKKEVVKATRISGVENLQMNQFLGDMYLDVNVYDNLLLLFNKGFVSPVANNARNFYRFYLEDSTFIDNQWCYKLTFKPKRTGDMTFEGEMWIHDTTYAVKSFKADIAPWANINYVNGLYIEQQFDMVAPEVWMLTEERMIADLKLTKESEVYGLYGRRYSSRKNFHINEKRAADFYASNSTVEILDEAKNRPESYWDSIRHKPLAVQEQRINEMIDSLEDVKFFRSFKNLVYFFTTGYYPVQKVEFGNAFNFISYNPVEKLRIGLALRTSNNFSRRIELGGTVAYGFGDERFKYGGTIRYNVTPKKRGMLAAYYNYDIEQIGQSPNAAAIGSTFGTVLRTGPLDKLTFVEKAGLNLEKDFGKDVIVYVGAEWKEYIPLGIANYVRYDESTQVYDTLRRIQTSEITLRYRWAKNEEFISGSFDRTSIRSKFPILSVQCIFGLKGVLGSEYSYQKAEFSMVHSRTIGPAGKLKYDLKVGHIFGSAAYPFLQVHAGNQSYWMMLTAFNKMDFFEFISDTYATLFLEHHFNGFILDRIPFNKHLKWRLVASSRIAYGSISSRHEKHMLIPEFTKRFGDTPYVEVGLGIENIFQLFRVDAVWRLTHTAPGIKTTDITNFGVRFRYNIDF